MTELAPAPPKQEPGDEQRDWHEAERHPDKAHAERAEASEVSRNEAEEHGFSGTREIRRIGVQRVDEPFERHRESKVDRRETPDQEQGEAPKAQRAVQAE